MLLLTVILNAALFVCVLAAVESSNEKAGYPVGFLGDCPGSTKEARITTRSLKYLTITVVDIGPGSTKEARITSRSLKYLTITVVGIGKRNLQRRAKYNYFQIKSLAEDKDLDFRRKTMMFVPGYVDHSMAVSGQSIAAHYKTLGYNVLLLDTLLFTARSYPIACRLVPAIGKHVAEMLATLTQDGLDPKKLELIGISLGGQTMSFIAKNYYRLVGRKISTLTGLDPSGPCFRHLPPEKRLDRSDTEFLQVVSTNIDVLGTALPIGHVQFYVNGGEYQPFDLEWLYSDAITSHIKVFALWISAIENPKSFIGIQCDSVQEARESKCYDRKEQLTNVMGLQVNRSREGIFYLPTDNKFPYCLGEKGLKRENDFYRSHLEAVNRDKVITLDLI